MATHIKQHWHHITKRLAYCLLALSLVSFSFSPLVSAEDIPTTEPVTSPTETPPPVEETSPPPSEPAPTSPPPAEPTPAPDSTSPAGPQSPPGAESDSYTYNESTGLWENSKYTWDPVTKQTSPKTTPTYSYNPSTGRWDTTEWVYDAPSGKYVPNIVSVTTPPEGALINEASSDTPAAKMSLATDDSMQSTSNTGPGSSNTVSDNSKPKGIFDLFYNAFISNNISSSAISGDALVNMNTLAGSALSGDAKAIATIFNLIQSSWNLGLVGDAFTSFTQSIFGNLVGDLLLNPGYTPTGSSSVTPSDITVNATGNAGIDNTITLEAISGDASVTNNTSAGDATTGSATAIANLINAINSSIITGHSFVGMLNIYGSLDGDILLPPDLINTLLASNAIGTLDTSQISNTDILGNFNNNHTIVNDISAGATSGDATVDNNTSAGSATTGDANTNVTLLNLTGRKVIGKNALLVFVNVLGTWVGMIVDAPAGTTSAALGSGITEDSTLNINDTSNHTITNAVDINAQSGDALVGSNTSAGNATSGDANAAVNILNMSNSQFALSDWFGVLFINVFGSWTGSFGIDTAAGTIPLANNLISTPSTSSLAVNDIRAFRFAPQANGKYTLEQSDEGTEALAQAGVLSSRASSPRDKTAQETTTAAKSDWLLTAIGVTVAFSLLGTERVLNRREAK